MFSYLFIYLFIKSFIKRHSFPAWYNLADKDGVGADFEIETAIKSAM